MKNNDPLIQALYRAGREFGPSGEVPLGFERRVMASVRAQAMIDPFADWIQGLWRAAIPSVGLAAMACLLVLTNADWSEEDSNPESDGLAVAAESVLADSIEAPDPIEAW